MNNISVFCPSTEKYYESWELDSYIVRHFIQKNNYIKLLCFGSYQIFFDRWMSSEHICMDVKQLSKKVFCSNRVEVNEIKEQNNVFDERMVAIHQPKKNIKIFPLEIEAIIEILEQNKNIKA